MNPFKKEPTMKEQLRASDRQMRSTTRDLDRERVALDRQEKQLQAEIKKAVKEGNQAGARVLAKSLIQTRNQKQKLLQSKAQISSVSTRTKTIAATAKMTEAMGGAAKVMGKMNEQVKPQDVARIMQQFERESQKMDMAEEMIGDGIDGVMGGEEEDAEVEAAMGEILDGVGIELSGKLGDVRPGRVAAPQGEAAAEEADLDDLSARLNRLRDG